MDEDLLLELIKEMKKENRIITERLRAVEKELRSIREDILSGNPQERMHKRILDKPSKKIEEIKEELDEEIKIEI